MKSMIYGFLKNKFVEQGAVAYGDVCKYYSILLPMLDLNEKDFVLSSDRDGTLYVCDWSDDRKLFPLKQVAAAVTKTNLFFRDVADDLTSLISVKYVCMIANICKFYLFTNDQATGILIWMYALIRNNLLTPSNFVLAMRLIKMVAAGDKSLTEFLKMAGFTDVRVASLVEYNVLLGSGLSMDLKEDAVRRIVGAQVKDDAVYLDAAKLRWALEKVKAEEMPLLPKGLDAEEHFRNRWEWTVNGAHNSRIEKWMGITMPRGFKNGIHRKVFFENIDYEDLLDWDGRCYASAALKPNDKGKARAIYSMDSRHYFYADTLVRPVEKIWNNNNVILNPGNLDEERVREWFLARVGKGLFVCADFKDMNALHTLESMKMVCEVMFASADKRVLAPFLASFDKTEVYVEGECLGVLRSGLMSGTRLTAFMNSVLNRAYFYYIYGDEFSKWDALHVGDDVVFFVKDSLLGGRDEAWFKSTLEESGFGFQPNKQSIGRHHIEFLRIHHRQDFSCGYLNRSISGLVSGNWVGEARLRLNEAVEAYYAHAYRLYMRSGGLDLGKMMITTVMRRLGMSRGQASHFVMLKAAPEGYPVVNTPNGRYQLIKFEEISSGGCDACCAVKDVLGLDRFKHRKRGVTQAMRAEALHSVFECMVDEGMTMWRKAESALAESDNLQEDLSQRCHFGMCSCGKFKIGGLESSGKQQLSEIAERLFGFGGESKLCNCSSGFRMKHSVKWGDVGSSTFDHMARQYRDLEPDRLRDVLLKDVAKADWFSKVYSSKFKFYSDLVTIKGKQHAAANIEPIFGHCMCVAYLPHKSITSKAVDDWLRKPDKITTALKTMKGAEVRSSMQAASYQKDLPSRSLKSKKLIVRTYEMRTNGCTRYSGTIKNDPLARLLRHPVVGLLQHSLTLSELVQLVLIGGYAKDENFQLLQAKYKESVGCVNFVGFLPFGIAKSYCKLYKGSTVVVGEPLFI